MKMYRVVQWSNDIEALEVAKFTDHTIWFKYKGSDVVYQERRNCDSHVWFKTLDEAKEYLLNRINSRIESINKELENLFAIKAFTIALKEDKDEVN